MEEYSFQGGSTICDVIKGVARLPPIVEGKIVGIVHDISRSRVKLDV